MSISGNNEQEFNSYRMEIETQYFHHIANFKQHHRLIKILKLDDQTWTDRPEKISEVFIENLGCIWTLASPVSGQNIDEGQELALRWSTKRYSM